MRWPSFDVSHFDRHVITLLHLLLLTQFYFRAPLEAASFEVEDRGQDDKERKAIQKLIKERQKIRKQGRKDVSRAAAYDKDAARAQFRSDAAAKSAEIDTLRATYRAS